MVPPSQPEKEKLLPGRLRALFMSGPEPGPLRRLLKGQRSSINGSTGLKLNQLIADVAVGIRSALTNQNQLLLSLTGAVHRFLSALC